MTLVIKKTWFDQAAFQFADAYSIHSSVFPSPADTAVTVASVNAGHDCEWSQVDAIFHCVLAASNPSAIEFWDFERNDIPDGYIPANNTITIQVSNSNWNADQTQMVWTAVVLTKTFKRVVGFKPSNNAGFNEYQYAGTFDGPGKFIRLIGVPGHDSADIMYNYFLVTSHVERNPTSQVNNLGLFDPKNVVRQGFGSVPSTFTGADNFDWNSGALIVDVSSIGVISMKGITVTLAELQPDVDSGSNYHDRILCRVTAFRDIQQNPNTRLFDPVFQADYAPFVSFGDWRDNAAQVLANYYTEQMLFDAFIHSTGIYNWDFSGCESLNANSRLTVVLTPMYDPTNDVTFAAYMGMGGQYFTRTLIVRGCISYENSGSLSITG